MKTLYKIAPAFNMILAESLDFEEPNDCAFDDDIDEESTGFPLRFTARQKSRFCYSSSDQVS